MTVEEILALQLISNKTNLPIIRKLVYSSLGMKLGGSKGLISFCSEWLGQVISAEMAEEVYARACFLAKQSHSLGIQVLIPSDKNFPEQLKTINEPPLILFIKGSIEALQGILVAVVGTRQASQYGLQVSYRIGERLAQQNVTVVSGLADGIDTQAHLGCLNANGITVAVLAHGLDMIYPLKNQYIAEQIIARKGCLVSEYPPQTTPQKYTFINRNRLQSGLSLGVIVVESQKEGGTMHTATFCTQQQRMLGCIVFPENQTQPEGNALLTQKAGTFCLRKSEDLNLYIDSLKGYIFSEEEKSVCPEKYGKRQSLITEYFKPKVRI